MIVLNKAFIELKINSYIIDKYKEYIIINCKLYSYKLIIHGIIYKY
jgi:hypothetical protein